MPLPKNNVISTILLILLGSLLVCKHADAGSAPVTGTYLRTTGKKIVLGINVSNPLPTNLIVEQRFPSGNTIVGAQPPPQKIDKQSRTVKWLVKKVRKGRKSFAVQLRSPVKGAATGTVRYRNPSNGQFTELKVTP